MPHRPSFRHVALPVLLAGFMLLPGCALLRNLLTQVIQPPRLEFQSADLRNLSLGGLTLDLTWKVHNPNDFGVSLAGLGYAVEVEGNRLASGHTNKELALVANGSSAITLPFDVRFQELSGGLLPFFKQRQFAWAVSGDFQFASPVGNVGVPFRREGTAPVPQLPQIKIEGARISNLSLTGAQLEVSLGLANPNAFGLPLEALVYNIQVAGQPVGTGRMNAPGLPANGAQTVRLPLQVNFTSVGRAVYDAIRSGQVNLGLTGSLDAGPVELPLELSRTVSLR